MEFFTDRYGRPHGVRRGAPPDARAVFRPVLVLLLITMTVAIASHLAAGEGPWHATEMATVFVALFLLGPGRYSLDAWLSGPPDAAEGPHVG